MSGILNVGTRALAANQAVLQTTGNNIANVNTPGYSRQVAVLATAPGQYSGGGYIGKGVDVLTIQRTYSEFLTRQSTLASATSAADTARADKLKQLESIFPGGSSGLGAAINDMLNAFSDVSTAPTDLTARTVALTRVSEAASRMRGAAATLDDLQNGVAQELGQKVDAINSLATSIAAVNEQIARAQGTGQTPNDLLDHRDQLVRDLNRYVQTSSIPADDGTVGIFIGGSQALVLGSTASPVKLVSDDFGDPLKSKLAVTRSGLTVPLDEAMLGGGEVAGLLRFQNTDLAEGRNLLGRLTLAVTTAMNDQHKLGLDLDGNAGGNLFSPTDLNTASNVLAPTSGNSSAYTLSLSVSDVTKFAASDYQVAFSSPTGGSVTRSSDGTVINFSYTAATGAFLFQTATDPAAGPYTGSGFDGLSLSTAPATTVAAGDRFLLKPFSMAARDIKAEFSTPRALAIASPVAGQMGATNTGSLQLSGLVAHSNPIAATPVVLTFTGPNSYTRSDVAGTFTYTSGQTIEGTVPATTPLTQWSLTLQGIPKSGDTLTVLQQPAAYQNLNAGNASAMMNLRDTAMFDGSSLSDGYASLISQIGIRTQSANYSADVSSTIAANLETARTAVSGVNLDEEAAKLIQYQQAYQASAKMIQIAQNIFDTLMQTMSR